MQLWQMSRFSLRAPEQNEKNPGGDEPAKPANICLCYIIVYIHILYIYRTPNNQFFWMDVWWNNHFPRHPTETIHQKMGCLEYIRVTFVQHSWWLIFQHPPSTREFRLTSNVQVFDLATLETRWQARQGSPIFSAFKQMAARVASKVSKRCQCFFLCCVPIFSKGDFEVWRRLGIDHCMFFFHFFWLLICFTLYYVLYIVYMV